MPGAPDISQNPGSARTFISSGVHMLLNLGHCSSFLFFHSASRTLDRRRKERADGRRNSESGTCPPRHRQYASSFRSTGNWPRSSAVVVARARIIARSLLGTLAETVFTSDDVRLSVDRLEKYTKIINTRKRDEWGNTRSTIIEYTCVCVACSRAEKQASRRSGPDWRPRLFGDRCAYPETRVGKLCCPVFQRPTLAATFRRTCVG